MTLSDLRSELYDLGELEHIRSQLLLRWLLEGFEDLCYATWAFKEMLGFLTTENTYQYTMTPTTSNTEVCGIRKAEIQTIKSPEPSAEDQTSGGSLADGTYSYKVVAVKEYQNTIPSAACAATISGGGGSGSVVLTWDAVSGAASYKVYGRTSSSCLYMSEVTSGLTYTDDGTDTPSGAINTTTALVTNLDVIPRRTMDQREPYWRGWRSGVFTGIIWDGSSIIELDRIPDEDAYAFQVEVALRPAASSVSLPESFEQHRHAIMNWARWRDAMTRDPALAQFYWQQYVKERQRLRIANDRGFAGDVVRADIQRFL